jgi:transposase
LAKLHRAGELTSVWIPNSAHEAIRDLVRARLAAVRVPRQALQQRLALLAMAIVTTGQLGRWLAGLTFAHAAH